MPTKIRRGLVFASLTTILSLGFLSMDFGRNSEAQAQNLTSRSDRTFVIKQNRIKHAVELNRLGVKRSGVVLSRRAIHGKVGNRNLISLRKNSGVRLGGNISRNRGYDLIERRRLNALRNIAVKNQNSEPFVRIHEPNVITHEEDSVEVISSGITVTRGAPSCPDKHNCGYRIYEDGTGPRIITPGLGPDDGLPEYDGVSGPLIITLD